MGQEEDILNKNSAVLQEVTINMPKV